jgi:transcriptional regulator with XRE-family HTH domain
MSHQLATSVAESPLLYVKVQSGRQIEEARKKRHLTQRDLARELGMGVRWLREIEAGNPRSRLDDHLACAYRLELSTGHILIPLLFAGRRCAFRGSSRWATSAISSDCASK